MRKLKLFSLAVMALFATGLWATEIFTATPVATSNVSVSSITNYTDFTSSQATFTGGKMQYKVTDTSNKGIINTSIGPTGDKRKCFRIESNNTSFLIILNSALQAGDVISADLYNNNVDVWFSTSTSRPSSAPSTKLSSSGKTSSAWNSVSYTVKANDGICGETNIYVYRNSNSTHFCNFVITRTVSTPTLTGAWMIGEEDVTGTSTNVMQSSSPAPTMPTFTVGATSGDPTGYYSVTYKLKDKSTEGIFTFTDGVPTAISTTTAGEATIVATLTTTAASKYLTPETNTFEYTVTVGAAAAPTFTSVTPSATSVVRGTASNIVAVVAGTPTPTIQWYSNTTASNEGGEAIEGETELTLNLTNSAVGTYYYYAVASNTTTQLNNVASDVQIITVAPKAPILPASAGFIDSKSIEIAKAEGEAAEAVIKYSDDGGVNWVEYKTAIELDATTTIQAKVEQSGISSAVASATYTLIVLDEQVDVTGSVTWDWTTVTNTSDVDLKTNGEILRNQDVLFSNISKYGYAAVAGLASQQALLMNGEYAYRNANGTKMCQVNSLQFNTTVPGTISIEYANTGNNNARTVGVKVSDGDYQYGTHSSDGNVYDGSDASKQKYVIDEFNVTAGNITIAGFQVSDKAAKMLRIRKVIFTEAPKYAITCADAENGSVSAQAQAHEDDVVTLTATPATGYELATLKVLKASDDSDVTGSVLEGYVLTMPAYDVKVVATFSAINYTITCNTADHGSVSAKATANYGEVVTLTVSPNDDYVATNVSYNGTTIIPVENVYSFIMPAEAVTVTATFAKSSTAVENVESSAKAVKSLKNGVLIIEKNGKKYNIIGSEIR